MGQQVWCLARCPVHRKASRNDASAAAHDDRLLEYAAGPAPGLAGSLTKSSPWKLFLPVSVGGGQPLSPAPDRCRVPSAQPQWPIVLPAEAQTRPGLPGTSS